jgi:hypothetical protein
VLQERTRTAEVMSFQPKNDWGIALPQSFSEIFDEVGPE